MPRYVSIALLFVMLVICTTEANAERVLEHYDVDSLSALAKLIVKAEVGGATEVKTPDGDCAVWDVTVLSALHGDVKPKTVIRVTGIEEYRKGSGIEGVVSKRAGSKKKVQRLSQGDIVYLFLVPKDAAMGYAKYRLTDADWKVVSSGTRLVVGKKVYSFGQYWPPGANSSLGFVAMTDETFTDAADRVVELERVNVSLMLEPIERPFPFEGKVPVLTVESFEQKVRVSLKFVADLRRKLSEDRLTARERTTILESRANVLKGEWATMDYIPRLMNR